MKRTLTSKAFYGKYVCKCTVLTKLASYFRNRKLTETRRQLQNLIGSWNSTKLRSTSTIKWNWMYPAEEYLLDEINHGIAILDLLDTLDSFKVRVEGLALTFYFNDESYIDKIESIPGSVIRGVSAPKNQEVGEFLLANPNIIFKTDTAYRYRLTVSSLNSNGPVFREWAEKIPKIKLSGKNNYKFGGYFYAADEKTVSICRLFLGGALSKIEIVVPSIEE